MSSSRSYKTRMRREDWAEYGLVLLAFTVLLLLTSPSYYGDMMSYTGAVAAAIGSGSASGSPELWEFGHLLWRPLGWFATLALTPAGSAGGDLQTALTTARIYIALSIGAALLSVALWYSMARATTGSRAMAVVVTLGFASGNGFLNYAQTGSSYVVGTALISLATWIAFWTAQRGELNRLSACSVGALVALATTFWFPFILAAPACVVTAILWKSPKGLRTLLQRDALVYIGVATASFVVVIGLSYGAALSALDFQSAEEFRHWVVDSGHGWSQSGTLARLATGGPRLFYDLGWDGLAWKRFAYTDPYAPVSKVEIVCCLSLWKLASSWAAVLGLSAFLSFVRPARPALLIFLVSMVPLVWFALFVMEPSSPERFLPAYPHLLLLFSAACAVEGSRQRAARTLVALFLATVFVANTAAMWRPDSERRYNAAAARVTDVQQRVGEEGAIYFLSQRDPGYLLKTQRPFHPLNRSIRVQTPFLIEPRTDAAARWKRDFIETTRERWRDAGEVWVTNRVLAERPDPDWLWVENDDPQVAWKDLWPFFRSLDSSKRLGGEDGFFLVDDTVHNQHIFDQSLAEGTR